MTTTQAPQGRQRRQRAIRSKAQLCLWLPPETLKEVRAEARLRGMPVCALIEGYIRVGGKRHDEEREEALALPLITEAVRAALDEQATRIEHRLAKLLARSIIATDTTRRLLFSHMARQWGGADVIQPVHDSARTASINALRERDWAAMLHLDDERAPQ